MKPKQKIYSNPTQWVDIKTGEIINPKTTYKTVIKTETHYEDCATGKIKTTIKLIKNHGKHEIQLELFENPQSTTNNQNKKK